MVEEFWGTLSIYDHRHPMFVRSLMLFDRIVVPVSPTPIYDLNAEELDRLFADTEYLQAHGAAIRYEWNPKEFAQLQPDDQDYIQGHMKEALAVGSSDALYESRLLLRKKSDELKPKDVMDVTAVPIYGVRESFEQARESIVAIEQQQLMVELSQLITVPTDKNVPLEEIIRLRESRPFIKARLALRDWQFKKIPQEIVPEKSAKLVALAVEDYKQMLNDYEEAMSTATFSTTKGVVTSITAIGVGVFAFLGHAETAAALAASAVPNLFTLKESVSSRWKSTYGKPFAAAGVVFGANQTLADL